MPDASGPQCAVGWRSSHQGNRISELSEKFGKVVVLPACQFELSPQGDLGIVLAHDVESHVAQDGEIVRTIVQAVSGLILAHGNVEAPMEAVFDAGWRRQRFRNSRHDQ
jgi:hypothetical protein